MLETNCPIIFVLVDIGLNFNGVFSNEIFSFILGLVHVEGELNASTLREGGDKEVDGTLTFLKLVSMGRRVSSNFCWPDWRTNYL